MIASTPTLRILGSGSSGNLAILDVPDPGDENEPPRHLLIDLGLGPRTTRTRLTRHGGELALDRVIGVLATHADQWDDAIRGNSSLRAAALRAFGDESVRALGGAPLISASTLWDMEGFYDSLRPADVLRDALARHFPPHALVLEVLIHLSPRPLRGPPPTVVPAFPSSRNAPSLRASAAPTTWPAESCTPFYAMSTPGFSRVSSPVVGSTTSSNGHAVKPHRSCVT